MERPNASARNKDCDGVRNGSSWRFAAWETVVGLGPGGDQPQLLLAALEEHARYEDHELTDELQE